MPFIESADNITIHYEDRGEGFPVVLIHGWGMSGRVWSFQEELSSAFRLIAVDLRGHGRSSAPASGYSFADLAADVMALFDRLGLERTALLGWSMGVQVALEAYPLLRERLSSLVLVSGTPEFTAADDWPHGLPPTEARGLALRLRRDFDRALGDFFRRMFAEGELSHEQYQRIVREIVIPRPIPNPLAVRECLTTLAEGDHRHILGDVALPTLVVHGELDTICPLGAGTYMAQRIRAARPVLMEGVGHAPFLSRPAEFNRMLAEFLGEIHGGN